MAPWKGHDARSRLVPALRDTEAQEGAASSVPRCPRCPDAAAAPADTSAACGSSPVPAAPAPRALQPLQPSSVPGQALTPPASCRMRGQDSCASESACPGERSSSPGLLTIVPRIPCPAASEPGDTERCHSRLGSLPGNGKRLLAQKAAPRRLQRPEQAGCGALCLHSVPAVLWALRRVRVHPVAALRRAGTPPA